MHLPTFITSLLCTLWLSDSSSTLPRSGETQAVLSGKSPEVLCYNGQQEWTPAHILDMWAPLRISVAAPDGTGIKVLSASEDDLHHSVEAWILGTLGVHTGDVDVQGLVAGPAHRGNNWLSLDFLSECPPPWSKSRSNCDVSVSAFGKSCIAVRAVDKKGYAASSTKGTPITVITSTQFRVELVTLFMCGLLLLFMSGELAKAKTFQYACGASLGVSAGALLVVFVIFRRKAARRSVAVGAATLTYAGAVCAFLRSYLARTVAAHWELCLAYIIGSAALGLYLTRVMRSDSEHKHRTRVLAKWLVRFVGAYIVTSSTYSGATQAIFLVLLVLWYIRYFAQKHGLLGAKKSDYSDSPRYEVHKYE